MSCKKCGNDCLCEKGPRGPRGYTGPQGIPGEQGVEGPRGIQGIPGINGLPGNDGNSPCCNFTVSIVQNETSSPEEPNFSAIVTPATPGLTYEWQIASGNDSMAITSSTTSESIIVDFFVNPTFTVSFGTLIYMETFRVIVRSEDSCCVADAYFNALASAAV